MPTNQRTQDKTAEFDGTSTILFMVARVVRRLYNLYHGPLSEYGLTPAQLFVFVALWTEDGINFSDLANRISIDVSTLTGIIDRMEKVGLVERKPDARDRRSIQLFLTSKAQQTGPEVLRLAADLDSVLRQPFPKSDIDTFERVLKALVEKSE